MTLLSSFPCRKWRRPPKSSSRCYMTSAAFGSISGHASKRHFQEALSRNIPRCFGMGTSALPKHQNPSSFGSWICPRKNFKPWVSRVSRETPRNPSNFPIRIFPRTNPSTKKESHCQDETHCQFVIGFPRNPSPFPEHGKTNHIGYMDFNFFSWLVPPNP